MRKLVWKQSFTSPQANLEHWNIRIGNDLLDDNGNIIAPGWGNGEEQYYTDDASNVYIDGDGLHLIARKQKFEHAGRNYLYTSARVDTKHKFSFCYGKVVVRAKLPIGQGIWPAIWLMPEQSVYGAWPASGEIDIMEARGRFPHKVSGTLHYGRSWDDKFTDEYSYIMENSTINEVHDYALEWEADRIRWLVDDYCYAEQKIDHQQMPFDQPFYLILNLAVGGWYDRVQIDEQAFPAHMIIEQIQIFQEATSISNL